jgi:hypothetical protein
VARLSSILLVLVAIIVPSGWATAQSLVNNPRSVEFTPSADHDAVDANAVAIVQRYELQIFLAGATAPMSSVSLGKPAPQSDGRIRVDFTGLLTAWPLAAGTYEARVAAIGVSAASSSDPSNPFDFARAACSWSLDASAASVAGMEGTGTVTLTASDSACAWTATSSDSWLSVSPASGSGTATLTYAFASNTTGAARSATVTVGGQSLAVTEAALPVACSFLLGSSAASVSGDGGTGTVTVIASAPTCAWSAMSYAGWLTIPAANGVGTGTLNYAFGPNTTGTARTGTIVLDTQVLLVTEAAQPAPCTFALGASLVAVDSGGGAGSVALTASDGSCAWKAASSANWLTLGTTSGTGSSTLAYAFTSNTSGSPRTATITAGGQVLTVSEEAVPACSITVGATETTVPAGGGTGTLTISANRSSCTWSAMTTVGWLTLPVASGVGSGTLTYAFSANAGSSDRLGYIQIEDKLVKVTESAAPCMFSLDVTATTRDGLAGTGLIALTASRDTCAWSATTTAAWISLPRTSGTGSAVLGYLVTKNATGTARTGVVDIANLNFSLTQTLPPTPAQPKGLRVAANTKSVK